MKCHGGSFHRPMRDLLEVWESPGAADCASSGNASFQPPENGSGDCLFVLRN